MYVVKPETQESWDYNPSPNSKAWERGSQWCKSPSEHEGWITSSTDVQGREKMDVPGQTKSKFTLLLAFYSIQALDRLEDAPPHWWGWSSFLSLPIQISSQNILTDTSGNGYLGIPQPCQVDIQNEPPLKWWQRISGEGEVKSEVGSITEHKRPRHTQELCSVISWRHSSPWSSEVCEVHWITYFFLAQRLTLTVPKVTSSFQHSMHKVHNGPF